MSTYGSQVAALGDPTRRRVFELLAERPLAVGAIAERIPVSRPAVSQHLRVLKDARLVTERREGTRRIYELDPAGLEAMKRYAERFWERAMAAYADEVETEGRKEGASMSEATRIAPVIVTASVGASVEVAWRVFTEGIGRWWPFEIQSVGVEAGGEVATAVVEPRVGGRVYERWSDGAEKPWGEVLAWEPPRRVVVAWKPNPAAVAATEVEVRFTPEGSGTTVELEHRGWERLGPGGDELREQYATGWPGVLAAYATAAA